MDLDSDPLFEHPSAPNAGGPESAAATAEFFLVDQRLELYSTLHERDEQAGEWYRGALLALSNPINPERFVQAAHSIRELMKNLHVFIDAPVQSDKARLGDKFTVLSSKWGKARASSTCHSDGAWDGPIDQHLRRALALVDSTVAWYRANRITWREASLT